MAQLESGSRIKLEMIDANECSVSLFGRFRQKVAQLETAGRTKLEMNDAKKSSV